MSKKVSISLCMIVKDEEKTLDRCLSSVQSFIDEIIIVDTGSMDSTKSIARKFGAKIYDFKWINDFASARNFAFSKATCEYVMWLDGDDFIDKDNIKKIETLLENLNKEYDYISAEYILGRNSAGQVSCSLRRNRIVKRSKQFKWIGHVHEYLEVCGSGFASDFAIEHGKVKCHTDRNIQIFKSMESNEELFTPRDLLYFANELRDNRYYEEAIENYRKFLDTKRGWIEDIKTAYARIIECCRLTGQQDKIADIAFESFKYDIPRGDICCSLGEYFIDNSQIKQAIFWYRVALDCIPEKGSIAIDYKDYYTWIPSLQLCVCYSKLGNLDCSYFYNEVADMFGASADKIKYNRDYFEAEYRRLAIDPPVIDKPIKVSDYIKYL